jgi:hypothetical protein
VCVCVCVCEYFVCGINNCHLVHSLRNISINQCQSGVTVQESAVFSIVSAAAVYSGVSVVFQWCNSVETVALQWFDSGVTVVSPP